MKLTLNGDEYSLPDDDWTVADLLEHLGLGGQAVAVEVNKQLVPKRRHDETNLTDGDVVEVVTLVGGG
ncbi:sulfur carrier protein ThiS [Planctomycetales bacterium ZRK34]|nr:sulfur carrier protein ThiS [Planctomycetales bacterium ZRK34]